MSTPRTNTTSRLPGRVLTALTICFAGIWMALACAVAPATAVDLPESEPRPEHTATMPNPGPPNYPNYDRRYEVPRVASAADHENRLDTTSVAVGTLGGIALAAIGLGITLGVQRRRDHSELHST